MESSESLLWMTVITIAAGIISLIGAAFLGIPSIVPLLLVGIIIGPEVLGVLDPHLFGDGFEAIIKGIEIVSGNALGVDKIGEKWGKSLGYKIKLFPANWGRYGKSAGYVRNKEMANYADALIAIWDGKSKGTKHMIDIAKKKGLKVFVYEISADTLS